jgi:hypothetical protein
MNTFGTEDNFSLVGRFIRKKFDDEKYHYGLVAKLDPLDNQIYQVDALHCFCCIFLKC